ncbi:MAG: hypothetical protein ACLSHC_01605 [Bilophila wadsworthia]
MAFTEKDMQAQEEQLSSQGRAVLPQPEILMRSSRHGVYGRRSQATGRR